MNPIVLLTSTIGSAGMALRERRTEARLASHATLRRAALGAPLEVRP